MMSKTFLSPCSPWAPCFILLFSLGCETRELPSAALTRDEPHLEPQPFVETVPGSTVTFTLRPVLVPEVSGATRTVWFAETETTWDAYDVFSLRLDENPDNVAAAGGTPDAITRPTQPYAPADRGWGHGGYPVISVTFNAATKYCEWLTQKTGRRYRLPTSVEYRHGLWETCTPSVPPADAMYWFAENSGETTQRVASRRPNQHGLYDMAGNVAEWCTDAGGRPVVCGGSFRDTADDVAARMETSIVAAERQTPDWARGDPSLPRSKWWLRNAPFVGFRVVCDDPPN